MYAASGSDLAGQLLVVSPLFFAFALFLHLFVLLLGHLVGSDLLVVAPSLLLLEGLPLLLLLHLVLQVVFEGLFVGHGPSHSLLLLVVLQFGILLLFLSEEVPHFFLFALVLRGRLVLVYALQPRLVVHELAVVLLIDCLFLGLQAVADLHLPVVFRFLSLPLLLLSLLHLLLGRQLLLRFSFCLLELVSLPLLLGLEHSLVVFQHMLLIFHAPTLILQLFPLLLLDDLLVFGGQSGPELLVMLFADVDLPLEVFVGPEYLVHFPAFLVEHHLSLLEAMEVGELVVVPG